MAAHGSHLGGHVSVHCHVRRLLHVGCTGWWRLGASHLPVISLTGALGVEGSCSRVLLREHRGSTALLLRLDHLLVASLATTSHAALAHHLLLGAAVSAVLLRGHAPLLAHAVLLEHILK